MVDAIRQMLSEIQTTGTDGDEKYQSLMDTLARLHKSGSKDKAISEVSKPSASTPRETSDATSAKESSAGKKKALVPADAKPPEPVGATESPADAKPKSRDTSRRRPVPGKIGGVLVERGLVQAEKIAIAFEEQEKGDQRKIGEILVSLGFAKQEDILVAQKIVESRAKETAPETIRVGANLLDNLMTLVGELVLARNQLLQFSNTFENASLQGVSQRMNLIATELQEEVMKTRMQPIGNIWNQLPSTVRDVALNCGKEVRIEMQGKESA